MASPFEILGIDPDADDGEIDRAYRERVKQTHPDLGGTAEEFQRVKEAYDAIVTGDPRVEIGTDVDVEPGPEPEERLVTVEYLDYEILHDHGWSLYDEDLFERAEIADLPAEEHGQFVIEPGDSLLEAAERRGFTWPYACRGGACANCAVAVIEGELDLPVDHILPPEMTERGIQLSCVGMPVSDDLKVVFNVKHLPELEELRLPPDPFERANPTD